MEMQDVLDALEEFGASLLEALSKEFCKVTKSNAERVIDSLTHPEGLDHDALQDALAGLGKSLLKKYLE